MSYFKRAWLYITRKKVKTLLMLLVLVFEYILYGKRGDKENAGAVKKTLTFFRNFMNFTSI